MKKTMSAVVLLVFAAALFAVPEREHFRRGPGMWEVFVQLDEAERAQLMKLQRENPEAFRQEMEKRAEGLYQEKLAKRAELQKLIDAYQATDDIAEKAEIKRKMQAKMTADFDQRLADHRRQLAEMKRHTARFEEKLEKRASRRDEIVGKMTDDLLSGKKKLMPVRRMPMPPPPPDFPKNDTK